MLETGLFEDRILVLLFCFLFFVFFFFWFGFGFLSAAELIKSGGEDAEFASFRISKKKKRRNGRKRAYVIEVN